MGRGLVYVAWWVLDMVGWILVLDILDILVLDMVDARLILNTLDIWVLYHGLVWLVRAGQPVLVLVRRFVVVFRLGLVGLVETKMRNRLLFTGSTHGADTIALVFPSAAHQTQRRNPVSFLVQRLHFHAKWKG